eukprot:1138272-Pelagomonas_calceolata.AAC.6
MHLQEASSIEIPNIGWDVFHCMMTYIYTGNVDVAPEIAPQLLQASDQYLLEGLKRLCEMRIAQIDCDSHSQLRSHQAKSNSDAGG